MLEIDVDRMKNGKALEQRLSGAPDGYGYPWLLVLDGMGPADAEPKVLATSIAAAGNIGCPVTEAEADHFFSMLRASRTRLGDAELAVLRAEHDEFAKPLRERLPR